MGEKLAVALTEIIEAALTIGSFAETVFRTFPMAGKQPLALFALGGQTIDF